MYKDYNDQELLYLISEGNEDANNILFDKYKPIIDIKLKKYLNFGKKIGLDYNDLFQEGLVGLSEAIVSYKNNKETKFSSFASLCIERQLSSLISSYNRKKYIYLNESCSLDTIIDDKGRTLMDYVFDDKNDPSIKIENLEYKKNLYKCLNNQLSDFEKSVFELKISGLDHKEISILLNKSYKSVDTALQRIRIKLRKFLKNL